MAGDDVVEVGGDPEGDGRCGAAGGVDDAQDLLVAVGAQGDEDRLHPLAADDAAQVLDLAEDGQPAHLGHHRFAGGAHESDDLVALGGRRVEGLQQAVAALVGADDHGVAAADARASSRICRLRRLIRPVATSTIRTIQ